MNHSLKLKRILPAHIPYGKFLTNYQSPLPPPPPLPLLPLLTRQQGEHRQLGEHKQQGEHRKQGERKKQIDNSSRAIIPIIISKSESSYLPKQILNKKCDRYDENSENSENSVNGGCKKLTQYFKRLCGKGKKKK